MKLVSSISAIHNISQVKTLQRFTNRCSKQTLPHHNHRLNHSKMPLVVPGLQSNDGGKTEEWMNKLVGKKIGDTSNETV